VTASDASGTTGSGSPETPTDYAAASRAALVEALTHAGPGRPTLCEGWNTEHLAAHIVLRETSPLAVGLLLRPAAKRLEAETIALGDAHADEDSYARLLERVAAGPLGGRALPDAGPRASGASRTVARGRLGGAVRSVAARLRGTSAGHAMADQVQLLEFFVHTEDVRRAQDRWAPRILADDYADTLYRHLKGRVKLLYREEPTGVELERRARPASRTDNSPVMAKAPGDDGRTVHVTGPVGELVMHAFGRRRAALVIEDVHEA
jgi:uncharacterized protein (TIGR03083 family)